MIIRSQKSNLKSSLLEFISNITFLLTYSEIVNPNMLGRERATYFPRPVPVWFLKYTVQTSSKSGPKFGPNLFSFSLFLPLN